LAKTYRTQLSRQFIVFCCISGPLTHSATAQSEIRVESPQGGVPVVSSLIRPYRQRIVPAVNLANSPRLDSLIRAGTLYLTAPDVVALAIENNLDIEVQRYGPLLAQEVLKRAKAGGALRSVGLGVAAGPQSVSLQGVSINATGAPATASTGVSSGGGIVTQLGPSLLALDPTIFAVGRFSHTSTPQSNTFLTGTPELIQNSQAADVVYQQNFVFGMSAQFTFLSQRVNANSSFYSLNPYTSGDLDFQVTQNLLQGFGPAVNGRNIRVQKNNQKFTDLQFKQQVITTVSAVLNLYWDLVSFRQDYESRQRELATAQQLLEDNRKKVQDGALAPIEITRAEAGVATAQQDLLVSQTNLLQQETVLKNALSRRGVLANLMEVHVMPLDTLPVPPREESASLEQMVNGALASRVEVQQGEINIDSNKLNLAGIKSSLRPTLQAFAELTNNALAGDLTTFGALNPAFGYLAGGYGNFLAQIFRRNYPNYSAGLSLSIPLRNRAAQADYVTSQLELRQNELNLQKTESQVKVDVQNALIGVQQALARYSAAARARALQQQTLNGDQERYTLGATTPYQVLQDERDLANAVTTEIEAQANYTHARIALDQALGITLEANHITLEEALRGRISRASVLPANLPPGGLQ
jgi:outer membrane protein